MSYLPYHSCIAIRYMVKSFYTFLFRRHPFYIVFRISYNLSLIPQPPATRTAWHARNIITLTTTETPEHTQHPITMGAKAGFTLKLLQWFNRGVQFACCALILALTSYFLAAMSNHHLTIPVDIRAVEGISGIGVIYTALGVLLVCCLAGFTLTSFIAIVLDVAFVGAFIYVATVYKSGASSCSGDSVNTVFGTGNADARVSSARDGHIALPTYRTACRMASANLAVAIVAM